MSTPTALVVEDDADLVTIFGEALRAAGFEVSSARSLSAALAQLAVTQPDVVTVDLHLGDGNGTTILDHIHSEARLAKTRVILTTADSAMAETLQGRADLVLVKPISFIQLRDLAGRLIMRKGT